MVENKIHRCLKCNSDSFRINYDINGLIVILCSNCGMLALSVFPTITNIPIESSKFFEKLKERIVKNE